MQLILASTSPYRRELLARLGVPFLSVAPEVHEDSYKNPRRGPRELAEILARAKAGEVATRYPDAVVIGSDQVAAIDGVALGKPHTVENAIAQIKSMSGRSHDLITAISVAHPGGWIEHTDVTTLVMRHLTDDSIRRYLEADQPLDCAGSYKLEARGITLFEQIVSNDHTAIVGLPLMAVTTILRDLGFAIP